MNFYQQPVSSNLICWKLEVGVAYYFIQHITKTRLYNFDPLKPHFYVVKLGFTGVYIIFLISAQKHRLWVVVRTHSLCFEQKYEIYKSFLTENFQILEVKFSIYLNRRVFVMKHNFKRSVKSWFHASHFWNRSNILMSIVRRPTWITHEVNVVKCL